MTWRAAALMGGGALLLVPFFRTAARRASSDDVAVAVRASLAAGVDSLDSSLAALATVLKQTPDDNQGVWLAFRDARARYKQLEGAIEFYAPALAAAFNSRRQEVDDDDAPPPSTLAASGFPALEPLLVQPLGARRADSARAVVESIRPLARRAHSLVPALLPTAAQLIEIARLELARVATLGIAGFDAPHTGEAIRESAAAIEGVRTLLAVGGESAWNRLARQRRALDSTLARATEYLRANPDFDDFNRLAFLVRYAEPAARTLDELRRTANVTPVRLLRGWRADAPSVYVAGAFDPRAYAPSGAPELSAALTALGGRLFRDPALSGTGTRSCESCHQAGRAFADGVPRAATLAPHGPPVARNTPTLINSALQPAQFADERSVTLEDQALEVLRSPSEMGSSAEAAAAKVARVPSYRSSFARVFGDASSDPVTPLRVRQALAAYVRGLVALDSRFDKAVRGDTAVLSAEERHGFTLFMGKGACGTCHFAPLFSGNTPPRYVGSDVEVIGTPASPLSPARLDPDSGRARVDHLPQHVGAFKTPTLRNIALTAPYMHNGAFRSLDDVLTFYDHGGANGVGGRIANQTLASDSLHLSAADRRAIVAFLGALTDTTLRARPAPR